MNLLPFIHKKILKPHPPVASIVILSQKNKAPNGELSHSPNTDATPPRVPNHNGISRRISQTKLTPR